MIAAQRKPEEAHPRPRRWLVRAAVYLLGIVVVASVVRVAATGYYETSQCTGSQNNCFAELGGFVWQLGAASAGLVVAVLIELALLVRRRRNRGS